MSHIVPTVGRQALRVASRRYPSSAFTRVPCVVSERRSYVSSSQTAHASLNVESTTKLDQKSYLQQTGERAEDATMPTTGMSGDVMMSPTAGNLCPNFAPGRRS